MATAKYDFIPKGYKVGKDGLLYHETTGEVWQTRKSDSAPVLPGTPKEEPKVTEEGKEIPVKGKGKKIL